MCNGDNHATGISASPSKPQTSIFTVTSEVREVDAHCYLPPLSYLGLIMIRPNVTFVYSH
jgi:hypothetical protein